MRPGGIGSCIGGGIDRRGCVVTEALPKLGPSWVGKREGQGKEWYRVGGETVPFSASAKGRTDSERWARSEER